MTTEYWRPWRPAVGDRVRVRLSAECQVQGGPLSYATEIGVRGHFAGEDGRLGTVINEGAYPYLVAQGHLYEVRFDEFFYRGRYRVTKSCYPALELEPAR